LRVGLRRLVILLTKSRPVELLGEAPPRVLVEPSGAKANSWEDVADLSARAGVVLDGWQELILKTAMGERRDKTWAAKRVGVTVPRQNGKSQLLVARALAGALLFGEKKIVKITGCPNENKTVSILLRGSNQLVLDEADRSLHDALCVVRALVKKRALVPGGAAVEMEVAQKLQEHARSIFGTDAYCVRMYGESLELIPYTLAENAGMDPINFVTELRNKHIQGDKFAGLNVRRNAIMNMLDDNVVQPALVSISALTLATECVRMILKIDDIVLSR
jgi:chaperonin GroEL (HSP60 family)